jgi:hypothetical protein
MNIAGIFSLGGGCFDRDKHHGKRERHHGKRDDHHDGFDRHHRRHRCCDDDDDGLLGLDIL